MKRLFITALSIGIFIGATSDAADTGPPPASSPADQTELRWDKRNLTLNLTIAQGASAPVAEEIEEVVKRLRPPAPKPWDGRTMLMSVGKGFFVGRQFQLGVQLTIPPETEAEAQVKAMRDALEGLVGKAKGMSAEQVQDKLEDLSQKIARVETKIVAMNELTKAHSAWGKQLAARIQLLQVKRQELEMMAATKQARIEALSRAIAEQKKRVEAQRGDDEISAQLKKLLAVQEMNSERVKKLHESGQANFSEVATSEAAIAEARLRLAERQAQLAKTGRGELLDRMADELAMVAVDNTELELQLRGLQQELSRFDPDQIGEKGLDDLVEDRSKGMGQKGAALYKELQGMRAKLVDEKFGFSVESAALTESAPAP